MEPLDLAAIRTALLDERARLQHDIAETIVAPAQMTYGSQAAAASQVFDQQRDLALRDRASQQLELVDAALARLDDGTYGDVPALRPADRRRARLEALPWAALRHRLPAHRRPRRTLMTSRRCRAPLVELEAIRAAADRLRGVALRTPLVAFGPPEDRRFLKAESLQPIGAFKLRGAYVAVASLSPEQLARGVITYSSGNHAQGVARAARLLGAPAVVVMPSDAPAIKRERVAADGAEIVVVGTASDERQRVAEAIAAERGLSVIPPYDDDRIIAGQGTIGLELLEDLPDLAVVLVPIGGGGLASGVATAIKALRPEARVIGVEPELAADARDSLERGEIVRWPAELVSRTIADGTRTQALGRAHFRPPAGPPGRDRDGQRGRDRRRRPSGRRAEPPGRRAVRGAVDRGDGVPCRRDRTGPREGPVVAIVSGGNVDPDLYRGHLAAPIPPEG